MQSRACILFLVLAPFAVRAAGPLPAQQTRPAESIAGGRDGLLLAQWTERMDRSIAALHELRQGNRQHADFLSPRDYDRLEAALADYFSGRSHLEEIAQRQKTLDADLRQASLRSKLQHDIELASFATEDAVLWRAINQSFHRAGIPARSGDRIVHELTASHPIPLADDVQHRISDVIRRRAWLLPAAENELRHAPPLEIMLASGRSVSQELERCHNCLVTVAGRLKCPIYRPLAFSMQQRRQVRAALQPGDILLTYTAGYVCNLVLPGHFKHAVTFVGTEDERRQFGLASEKLLAMAVPNNQRLTRSLKQAKPRTGEQPDIVEAIAEGVLFSSFDTLLTTRVNRLVVLRPRLTDDERARQIADVLSYVGDEFDFSFDLTDASDQVCTEVVYRSLQGRGNIDLPLSVHAGRLTLPPDDILKYALQHSDQFECVLLVEEAMQAPQQPAILSADEARQSLARLLPAPP